MRGSIEEMLEAFKVRISELSQNTVQSAEDIDRPDDDSDDYIAALHECVNNQLGSEVDSCMLDKDDNNLYFIVTTGSDVQEFKVPNSDISWEVRSVDSDAEYICEAINDELNIEVDSDMDSVESGYVVSSKVLNHKVTSKNWNQFIQMIEDATGLYVDAPDSYQDNWIELVDWDNHRSYEAEITRYSDGTYELVPDNISSPISGSEIIFFC